MTMMVEQQGESPWIHHPEEEEEESNATTLFCFEVYITRVEKLPTRLQSRPPAFAVQFLDYAPVIIVPPPEPEFNGSAMWYGAGKRCLFEEDPEVLRRALDQRGDEALVILEIDQQRSDVRKRTLYGSATASLAGFTNPLCDEPHGAVQTWGRKELTTVFRSAHVRSVTGVATLSVSLASFDNTLRAVLGPATRKDSDSLSDIGSVRSSRELHHRKGSPTTTTVQEKTDDDDRSCTSSLEARPTPPPETTTTTTTTSRPTTARGRVLNGDQQLHRHLTVDVPPPQFFPSSPQMTRGSTASVSPPTIPRGDSSEKQCEQCVDTTVRMGDSSAERFDGSMQAALLASIAKVAEVPKENAELLSWRSGSLIVDVRIRFGPDAHRAQTFAERLDVAAPTRLVPRHLFGPYEILDVAHKCCMPRDSSGSTPRHGRSSIRTSSSSFSRRTTLCEDDFDYPECGDGNLDVVPAPPLVAPDSPRSDEFFMVQRQSSTRTFEVFRGGAFLADDDSLAECAPPLFHSNMSPPEQRRHTFDERPPCATSSRPRLPDPRRHQRRPSYDGVSSPRGKRDRLLKDATNRMARCRVDDPCPFDTELRDTFDAVVGPDGMASIRELRAVARPASQVEFILATERDMNRRINLNDLLVLVAMKSRRLHR